MKTNKIIKEFTCIPEKCTYNAEDYKIYACKVNSEKFPDIKKNKYKNVSLVGNFHTLAIDVTYTVKAEEQENKKGYGTQYQVLNIKREKPTDEQSTRQFLSEIITRPQTEVLLDVYPDIVDRVIKNRLNDIDLSKTKGIKDKTFNIIKKKIIENFCLVDIVEEFQGMLSISVLKKLYEKYPSLEKIKEELKEQPYKCLAGLSRIGFKTADGLILEIDRISKEQIKKGESPIIDFGYDIFTSPQREKACIMHLLKENESNGHTRMEIKELKLQSEKLTPSCDRHFVDIIKNDEHIYFDQETKSVALTTTYKTEQYIGARIKESLTVSNVWDIDWTKYTNSENITLTDEQSKALEYVCKYNLFILNGNAGSGKSASTNSIIKMLKDNNKSYKLFAPTGKASKVLSNYTNTKAFTIHRGLGFMPPNSWVYNEAFKLDCDVLIIDEASMTDIFLFKRVLEAVDFKNTKLILIGDDFQLASVGAGNLLFDLLNSKIIPKVTLTKIFRYGKGGLMTVATNTRLGKKFIDDNATEMKIYGEDKSYCMIPSNQESMMKNLKLLYSKLVKNDGFSAKDILILSSYNKGDYGTVAINKAIQPIANNVAFKNKFSLGETIYYVDDLVIQCVNNYNAMIYTGDMNQSKELDTTFIPNGEIGRIVKIIKDNVIVDFDGLEILYSTNEINQLKLAYAISVHRSQGSQSKIVILITPKAHCYMLNANLLYVGETRAQSRVYHFGDPLTINRSLKKKENFNRKTFLKEFLK